MHTAKLQRDYVKLHYTELSGNRIKTGVCYYGAAQHTRIKIGFDVLLCSSENNNMIALLISLFYCKTHV